MKILTAHQLNVRIRIQKHQKQTASIVAIAKLHRSSKPDRCSTSPPAGFTLLELLVAIAIMGIVAAIAIPSLFGIYQHQQLSNAANQMASDIKTARARALSNYQDQADASKNPDELSSDCDGDTTYINDYAFSLISTGDPYAYTGYQVVPEWRATAADGVTACKTNPTPDPIITRDFNSSIKIMKADGEDSSYTGFKVAEEGITYDTVTGRTNLPSAGHTILKFQSKAFWTTIYQCLYISRTTLRVQAC